MTAQTLAWRRKVDRVTANHYLSLTASQETSKRALTYRTGNSLHELEVFTIPWPARNLDSIEPSRYFPSDSRLSWLDLADTIRDHEMASEW